ncbi:MAG: hypothetical protein N4A57_18065 [Anaeromicrobium sp.]|jgi:hypothetical protein|uniref:hypothetical protein n=1 Tax=Anaeromicrobium sp. TaxID=1929132 RepID=UPI0025D3E50E|nr:hypothetical protein [Anaeromicrobium sp.]MCT4596156.1 hypothetical protein [Anaeromicrobium sp.]
MKHINFFKEEKSKRIKYINYILISLILCIFICEGYILKKKSDIIKTFNKIDYANAKKVKKDEKHNRKIDEEIENISIAKKNIIDKNNISDLLVLTITDILPEEISLETLSISEDKIFVCGRTSLLGSLQNYKNSLISLNVFENIEMETKKGKNGYEFNLSFDIGMN